MMEMAREEWMAIHSSRLLHHIHVVYISINKNLMILVLFKMIGTMGLSLSLLGFHLEDRDLKIIDI